MIKEIILKLDSHNLPTNEFRKNKLMLNLNENVYGCSKKIKKIKINKIKFNEYPDDNCGYLINHLADFYNISPDNIMIGNGSGEILQILSRAYLKEGDEVLTFGPTYPYYRVESIIEGSKYEEVELKEFKLDIDNFLKKITDKTKIIYITNPNNPTGTIISDKEFESIISKINKNILIVVDEAYYEYVTSKEFPDTISKLKNYKNICVLRTFSKIYGLASLRIGYIIGSKQLIKNLNKVRLTFNVSKIGQLIAIEALKDQEFIKKCRKNNEIVKKRLYTYLDSKSINFIPSETNFVLIQDKNGIYELLEKNNIIVKKVKYMRKNYIRLSLCKPKALNRIMNILDKKISNQRRI